MAVTHYTNIKDIPNTLHGSVIAIGNFDGVHKGHQILIAQAKEIAQNLNVPLGVMTFAPHPRQFFQVMKEPFRLITTPQRTRLLNDLCDVDFIFTQNFDDFFASLSPKDFIHDILIHGLCAQHIVIGHDFCFGKMRAGNAQTLSDHSDFETTIIEPIKNTSQTIYSSSQIRNNLRRGDMDAANSLLGWDWHIESTVIHGDKRGRELGYPTANMDLGDILAPALGVYATRVQLEGESAWRPAVTNIGIRPMFQAQKPLVETFIFDFDRDIYGQTLKVQPVQFLRGEAKFDSLDALITQMDKDSVRAREILKCL